MKRRFPFQSRGRVRVLTVRIALAGALLMAACSDQPSAAPDPESWNFAGNLELGPTLAASRLASASCFQWQRSATTSDERVLVSPEVCPAAGTLVGDNTAVLKLSVRRTGETLAFQKDGVMIGLALETALTPLATADSQGDDLIDETAVEAATSGAFRIQHLCQFSEPIAELVMRKPYFYSLCEVIFEESGALKDIRVFSLEEILAVQTEEREALLSLSARLEQERKELLGQVKRLQDSITHLQYQADTEEFLNDTEQRVDALRTELRLNTDATPEAIGAAVQKQGVLISQFSREIAELKKTLELPKNASFEDVLKALRSIKKAPEAVDEVGGALPVDRKDPAKSPITP